MSRPRSQGACLAHVACGAAAAAALASGPGPVAGLASVHHMLATSSLATVEGNRLYGDAYLVTDGTKQYSVLDVYIKATQSTDIVDSVYGLAAYKASWVQNQTLSFRHAGNSSWNPNYTDAAGAAWDSFVTAGLRTQTNDGDGGTAIALTANFSSFNQPNATRITGPSTGNGPGWYPAVGSSPTTNPYCVVGYYNGAENLAKTTQNITANGINAGGSLDNMFMIARLAIDTADMGAGVTPTITIKLTMTVLNTGSTGPIGGGTSTAYRANSTLSFVTGSCITNDPRVDCDGNGRWDECDRSATTDTDNDGKLDTCERRRGDLDLSGTIDAADLGALLTIWDTTPAWGDLDGDGRISGGDLAEILLKFGQPAP